ncbi:hypothetical protein [Methanosarcina barkeri]|nr:hypothetical protein [Methanosarcina barkeri]
MSRQEIGHDYEISDEFWNKIKKEGWKTYRTCALGYKINSNKPTTF